MTLLKMDSFDHYATADISKKWQWGGGGTIDATAGRGGTGAFVSGASNTGWIADTFAANASWVIGLRVKFAGTLPTVAPNTLISLLDAGTEQITLHVRTDGVLEILRFTSTSVTGGASVLSFTNGVFYYVELKITIANSIGAGTCKVRVNGVDWITVATGQDLQATANATANQVRIGTASSNSTPNMPIDDVYICDQSGSANNDFLGDCRVDALFPTSDGNYTDFTPSTGVSHFVLVDESTPNTTDYNSGTTVGNRDSYGMSNLVALTSQTVYGVQANLAVLKDDAGAKSIAPFVRSVSTNDDGASVGVGTSQFITREVFEQDPNAAAAWTEATVNAAELGALITV